MPDWELRRKRLVHLHGKLCETARLPQAARKALFPAACCSMQPCAQAKSTGLRGPLVDGATDLPRYGRRQQGISGRG